METQPSQCRWLNIYKRTTGASRSLRSIKVLHWIFSGCTVLRVTHSTMLVAEVLLLLFGLLTVHGGDPNDADYIDYGTDSPVDSPDNRSFSTDWLWDLLEESNSCDPNPCLHGGSCQQQSDAGYTCSCPEPYAGKKCQSVRNVCENVTCGRGICLIKLHESPFYECKCRPPFHGPNCGELPASPCEPNPCKNGGSCIKGDRRYRCACPDGYKGRFCEAAPGDCYEGNGESYKGVASMTEEGEECLHWSSYFIRQHGGDFFSTDPTVSGLEDNHCRNPDGDKKPWCYIKKQGKLDWSHCNVRKCSGEPVPPSTPVPPETGSSQFSQCGKPLPGRVYGGIRSLPGVNPWQASVQVQYKGSSSGFMHYCGGVLISSCWVLTAGHCIDPNFEYQVMLGGVSLHKMEKTEQTIPVIETILHENYTMIPAEIMGPEKDTVKLDIAANDIALLKLSVAEGHHCAKETPFVRTACLTDQTFPAGKECMISGWGSTENRTISPRLLKARVSLISDERCKAPQVYGDLLDSSMLCAGVMEGGVDSCQGDSGGPLVCEENGSHYITGLVSWGYGCGVVNKPSVYTDVHEFLSWIRNKTTGN